MDLEQNISEISPKATKTLGFLPVNLTYAPRSSKEEAHKTLVWPKLEYAASVWSPNTKLYINHSEAVHG